MCSPEMCQLFRETIEKSRSPILEWRYEQRREMQEILPGIFLGPYTTTKNKAALEAAGITHIVSLQDASEQKLLKSHFSQEFVYLQIRASDSSTQNLIRDFPQVRAFMDQALQTPNGKVLLTCIDGISRSPTFVVAYVMERTGLEKEAVYAYVQNKRFCINPNPGFKQQLSEYAPIYTAMRSFEAAPTEVRTSQRRSAPDEDDEDYSAEMDRQAPNLRQSHMEY